VASIEKRVRNGKTSYSVRYRDPASKERRKVFARKVDAERWRTEMCQPRCTHICGLAA